MSKYRKVEYLTEIINFHHVGIRKGIYLKEAGFFNDAGLVRRDFYFDIGNGRRDYILAYKNWEAFPLSKVENLQQRVEQGKVFVKGITKRKSGTEILSQEEFDALLNATDYESPKSAIGPHPLPKKVKFSKNDPLIKISLQFEEDMRDPENYQAFVDGRLDDIKHTSKKGENKK